MIWIRAFLLAVIAGMVVVALEAKPSPDAPPAPEPPTEVPTAVPTRVPLPTAPPQMIISRISRETPTPRATSTPSSEPRMWVVDNGYIPAQAVVHVGERVTWVNGGGDGHDITGTGPGGAWRSGPLAPMESYQRSFPIPGTYDYSCSIHPEMRGRITVQP